MRIFQLRLIVILATVVLAVFGGYTVFWYRAASVLETEAKAWMARAGQNGYEITTRLEISGYPFAIRADFIEPSITAPASMLTWSWSTGRLSAFADPLAPGTIELRFDGRHMIALNQTTAAGGVYAVDIAEGRAVLDLDSAGLARLTADISGVTVTGTAEHSGDAPRTAGIARVRLLFGRGDDDKLRQLFDARSIAQDTPDDSDAPLLAMIALDLQDVTVPGISPSVLGDRIEVVDIEAALHAHDLPALTPDSLVKWVADGGALQISYLGLDWGPLKLKASGPLGVDGLGRPTAALDAHIIGHELLFDAIVEGGLIDRTYAATAKMLIGLLPVSREQRALSMPIIIDNGLLFFGPVPILAVDPLSQP